MPLALDNDMLQYDVDSDDEWDQEDEAEVGGPVIRFVSIDYVQH